MEDSAGDRIERRVIQMDDEDEDEADMPVTVEELREASVHSDDREQGESRRAEQGDVENKRGGPDGAGQERRDSEQEGDEDDEDEEEDDEDDEDEDEGDGSRPSKRRRQDRPRNQFLDVEAEVDEEDEGLEDEEDDFGEGEGFIQDQEELEAETVRAGDDRHHRELDRQRQTLAEQDAEALAEQYREKYGRSKQTTYHGDTSVVPQRLLLPSVNDPNIWGVRCKPGRERDIIALLMRKMEANQFTAQPLEIISAFQRDGFRGYIYIEARKQAHVLSALKGIVNVFTSRTILVPIKEMPDLLRVNKSKSSELLPGAYVRIKKGKYAGDIAQVDDLSENGLEVRLRIVPRVEYNKREEEWVMGKDGKRKRVLSTVNRRPVQRLFSPQDAMKSNLKALQKRGPSSYIFNGDEFEDGYLLKDFKLSTVIVDGVNPSLEEVTRFAGANDDEDNGIDLSSLAASMKASNTVGSSFQPGDHVQVFQGEQTSVVGVVVSVSDDIATIAPDSAVDDNLKDQRIEIPMRNLRKRFKQGDHVKVTAGKYKDETGMIVRIPADTDTVTLLTDTSMTEVTVFSKDLREAVDIGGANVIGKYGLHDLVQLDLNTVACITKVERESFEILDQNGRSRLIMPSQISMKVQNKFSVATDRDGSEIRVGDTAKESEGEGRQGTILHIHRAFLFLYNRDITENSGVFVTRTRNVATIAAKNARVTQTGPDLNRMNPSMQINGNGTDAPVLPKFSGRDKAIGASVTIKKGGYKGLIGIVKDTTDQLARVELHTNNKIVTVEKDKLSFKDPKTGISVSYTEYVYPRRSAAAPPEVTGFNQPSFDSGRTPAWASGSRTPAYGGGRTPSWAAGSRTPGYGDGGRTPAWSGGRTPAYLQDGSRTPAFNPGSRTPRYGEGNRTPNYGEYGSAPTPGREGSVWNAGSRTPGRGTGIYDEASSSVFSSHAAPWEDSSHYTNVTTPGFQGSAPTPGAAATPGAWADARTPWDKSVATPYASANTPGVHGAPATPGLYGGAPTPHGYEGQRPPWDSEEPVYAPNTP